jgi:hypothetical protein
MVLWCKLCGAFMGLRDPISDWSTDRGGICAICAEKQIGAKTLEAKISKDDLNPPEKDANPT